MSDSGARKDMYMRCVIERECGLDQEASTNINLTINTTESSVCIITYRMFLCYLARAHSFRIPTNVQTAEQNNAYHHSHICLLLDRAACSFIIFFWWERATTCHRPARKYLPNSWLMDERVQGTFQKQFFLNSTVPKQQEGQKRWSN